MTEKYKNLSQEEINKVFEHSCFVGNFELVKYLLTSTELSNNADIHYNNDVGFLMSCENGHLNIVKYLLTSNELSEKANIHANNDVGLRTSCSKGYLDIVEYLLTSPELKKNKAHIHALNDGALDNACYNGHLDVVKFLVSSPKLKQKANPIHSTQDSFRFAAINGHADIVKFILSYPNIEEASKRLNIYDKNSDIISCACESGNIELVKYLLTNEDLHKHHRQRMISDRNEFNDFIGSEEEKIDLEKIFQQKLNHSFVMASKCGHIHIAEYLLFSKDLSIRPNIHASNDAAFKNALLEEKYDFIQYLIFDLKIDKTEEITKFLNSNNFSQLKDLSAEKIENMFKIRDLNIQLKNELVENNFTKSKTKKI